MAKQPAEDVVIQAQSADGSAASTDVSATTTMSHIPGDAGSASVQMSGDVSDPQDRVRHVEECSALENVSDLPTATISAVDPLEVSSNSTALLWSNAASPVL